MDTLTIKVIIDNNITSISCQKGSILKDVLKENKIPFYGKISKYLNCKSNGLCATCGVYIMGRDVEPSHWHDKFAQKYGYPRLSCQITVEEDLMIKIPENKIIWGQILPKL